VILQPSLRDISLYIVQVTGLLASKLFRQIQSIFAAKSFFLGGGGGG
jgi:hypothetical protein